MRPIFWGIILCVIGAIGWVVSVVFAVLTLGALKIFTWVFGILFVVSIPAALVFEVIRWAKKSRR